MTEHHQYVFIGSGVAAVTVAKRLLEDDPKASILMLDAGPEVKAKDRRYWWDYLIFNRKPYDYTYDIDGENTTEGDIDATVAKLLLDAAVHHFDGLDDDSLGHIGRAGLGV